MQGTKKHIFGSDQGVCPLDIKGHKPVLLEEILTLAPFTPLGQGKHMLDTTLGCGGHTKAFLKHFPKLSVTALDRDPQAIEWNKTHTLPVIPKTAKLKLYHSSFHPFSKLKKKLFSKEAFFDIILLDLGVSSLQLDQAKRGFSFYKNGPLDMRMDPSQSLSARDIINQASPEELNNIFFHYEEKFKDRHSGFSSGPSKKSSPNRAFKKMRDNKVVTAILKEREKKSIESTKELSDLIVKQTGWRKKGQHPATTYFLSLRLKVNEELSSLAESLPEMIKSLKPQGRIFVLSFHSAEDRIVKFVFKKAKENQEGRDFKKVIFPSRFEIKQNPRARSAKLRVLEKV